MNVGIVLLARMSSTRLPGKVLMDLCGKPILAHIVNRLKKVKQVSTILVATTTNPADDAIVEFCKKNNIPFSGVVKIMSWHVVSGQGSICN